MRLFKFNRSFWIVAFTLFFTVFLNYCSSLKIGFIGDDYIRIVDVFDVFSEGPIESMSKVLTERPLLTLINWLNFYIFGPTYLSFKWINLFFLGLVGLCFFYSASRLTQKPGGQDSNNLFLIAATLLVSHPIMNNAVNIIVQRGVLISTALSLLTISFWIKSFEQANKLSALLASLTFVFALYTKPINFPLVFVMMFTALLNRSSITQKSFKSVVGALLAFMTIVSGFAIFFQITEAPQSLALSPGLYFLTQMKMIWIYFYKIIYPYRLQYLFDVGPDPKVLSIGLGFAHLIAFVAILKTRKLNANEKTLCTAGYFSFATESSIFPIIHIGFEHRMILPFSFFFLAAALRVNRSSFFARLPKRVFTFCFLLLLYWVGANHKRNIEITGGDSFIDNTLSFQKRDHLFNTQLIFDGLRARELRYLKKYSEILAAANTDHPFYELQGDFFRLTDGSPSEQMDNLKKIAKVLQENPQSLDGYWRRNFTLMTYYRLGKLNDSTVAAYRFCRLIIPQLKGYTQYQSFFTLILDAFTQSALLLIKELPKKSAQEELQLTPEGAAILSNQIQIALDQVYQARFKGN